MKSDGDKPVVGAVSMALGVRSDEQGKVPDIPVDDENRVHPATGGMSVYESMRFMPPHMVPQRLRHLVPSAAGSNNLRVWTMGEGTFEAGTLTTDLVPRLDPYDEHHGFVEPHAIMGLGEYQQTLAATSPLWRMEES